jgi:hypothetical protein
MSAEPQRHELRCSACGYGICVEKLPPACPICQSDVTWVDVRQPAMSAMLETQAIRAIPKMRELPETEELAV